MKRAGHRYVNVLQLRDGTGRVGQLDRGADLAAPKIKEKKSAIAAAQFAGARCEEGLAPHHDLLHAQ